jgi:enoyl-CoA hydratase/carnithine racemase
MSEAAAAQDRQLDLERDMFVDALQSSDAREGVAAFLEKRKADLNR